MLSGLLGWLAGLATSAVLAIVPLPTGTDVDYQLGGAAGTPSHVGIVVRDRTAAPEAGVYDVCYVNGFQAQPGAGSFWRHHEGLLLHDRRGRPVVDTGWGETLLDISTPARRRALTRVVGRWLAGCARDGYQAAELDNLDSFTRSHGLLTRADAIDYARRLVAAGHAAGLAMGQKNLPGFDGRSVGYDFAIAEECGHYDECGRYVARYGDAVLMSEYRRRDFERTCAGFGATHAVELRDRDLTPDGVHAWC